MSSYNKTYTITEYGGFTCGKKYCGYQALPEKTFTALESFLLTNDFFTLSARRGAGKIITARNYVGIITMKDGTAIEILPKIAGAGVSISDTKRIFLDMLRALNNVTFKDFNLSSLHTERLSLLEIFIKMFLKEVYIVTRQGLKAAYSPVEENERFYKGKLRVTQNVKHNLVHKDRFFVCYDEFIIDRPENRLIKSTLDFLFKFTRCIRSKQSITRFLSFFESVEYSKNYEADFSKCFIDRAANRYAKIISWCRVFLRGNSFSTFAGSEIALGILFPMEQVFERYIAAKIRKSIGVGVYFQAQDSKYSLFNSPVPAFTLRPDIVLRSKDCTVVLDTKWKLLSQKERSKWISQSDMYQMYVYGKKYNADKVVLLYPQSDSINQDNIWYKSDDGVTIEVFFIDLKDIDSSIERLIKKVMK